MIEPSPTRRSGQTTACRDQELVRVGRIVALQLLERHEGEALVGSGAHELAIGREGGNLAAGVVDEDVPNQAGEQAAAPEEDDGPGRKPGHVSLAAAADPAASSFVHA
jgi:hypothetical protein